MMANHPPKAMVPLVPNDRLVTLTTRLDTMQKLRVMLKDAREYSVQNVPEMLMLSGDGDGASTMGVEGLIYSAINKLDVLLDRVRNEATLENIARQSKAKPKPKSKKKSK